MGICFSAGAQDFTSVAKVLFDFDGDVLRFGLAFELSSKIFSFVLVSEIVSYTSKNDNKYTHNYTNNININMPVIFTSNVVSYYSYTKPVTTNYFEGVKVFLALSHITGIQVTRRHAPSLPEFALSS